MTQFLTIMKWMFIGVLVLYIWRAMRENSSTPPTTLENYDNTVLDTSEFNVPINAKLEPVETINCQECKSGGSLSGGKLLPVMDPCFNMREVCKQCILLEDHLNSKGKDCIDCCQKHFLTIEALCEEAVGLDKKQKYPEIRELPDKIRCLIKDFDQRKDKHEIAQELRQLRKSYMGKYFASF